MNFWFLETYIVHMLSQISFKSILSWNYYVNNKLCIFNYLLDSLVNYLIVNLIILMIVLYSPCRNCLIWQWSVMKRRPLWGLEQADSGSDQALIRSVLSYQIWNAQIMAWLQFLHERLSSNVVIWTSHILNYLFFFYIYHTIILFHDYDKIF